MSRKEEIRAEIEDLLNRSVEQILKGADGLLAKRLEFILAQDEKAGGPMVLPKDILVALLMREIWAWGPPGAQVSIKVPVQGLPAWKRSIRTINTLRRNLS